MAEDARERYIRGSNTPGSVISEQNRWEKAGGRGAYPVMKDTTYSSIMNYDPTNPFTHKAPLRQEQNPSFISLGDFRYRGKNPALNPGEPWEVYNRDIDTSFSPGWIEAKSKWKDNIPLMLRSLRQRDEFKDWSDDELTHYMHRTFSNRGGIMSLV